MQRGMVIVHGVRTDGTFGEIDVLDLEEESFRCYVLDGLSRLGVVDGGGVDQAQANRLAYRQRVPPGHPRTK
jgi:hypothetical protein